MVTIRLIEDEEKKSYIVDKLIRQLPKWFDENAFRDYPEKVKSHIFYTAYLDNEEIGFISLKMSNKFTGDIFACGILENHHGNGIGKKLINVVEKYLRENGYKFLMVKTLSESSSYEPYKGTREFYKNIGFYPVDEIKEVWGEENPCLIMIKNV